MSCKFRKEYNINVYTVYIYILDIMFDCYI